MNAKHNPKRATCLTASKRVKHILQRSLFVTLKHLCVTMKIFPFCVFITGLCVEQATNSHAVFRGAT